MEEKQEQQDRKKPREFRGLYKYVHVSVRTLDIIIVACIAVILIVLAFNLLDPGFSVSFDSRGGTDVPPQKRTYGEYLVLPEEPSREGYEFTGWYLDPSCQEEWNIREDTVKGELTLYAGSK